MTGVLRDDDKLGPWPTPPGLALLAHRENVVAFAVSRLQTNRGVLVGDVMGLGKTIEAIVLRIGRTGLANTIRCWLLLLRPSEWSTDCWTAEKTTEKQMVSTLFWARRQRKTSFGH
jgi:hypothetical protein